MRQSADPKIRDIIQRLSRYRKSMACTARLREKLAEVSSRAECNSSPTLSDMPRSGTAVTMEELVCEKVELEERLKKSENRTKELRAETIETIDLLDNPAEAEILEAYFLDGESLEAIGKRMYYSRRQAERLFHDGLEYLVNVV